MSKNEQLPTPPTQEDNESGLSQDPWFTPERIEALRGPARIVVPGEGKLSQTGTLVPVEIEGYERTDYQEEAIYDLDDPSDDKKPIGHKTEPHHYLRFKMEDGTLGWKEVEHFSFSEERKKHLEEEGFMLDSQLGNITVPPMQQGEEEEPTPTRPEAPAEGDQYASANDAGAETPAPVTPATEQWPVKPGSQPQHEETPEKASRWASFKRAVRKHMYETPVDMSPMGPTIQPEIPFDEWYAQKEQEPGRLGRAFDKTAEKIEGLAGKTAENMGELTAFVGYMGNIALMGAAEYARHLAENAKEGTVTKAKQVARGTGKLTRKMDNTGNAAMDEIALKAAMGAELADEAGRRARRIGRKVLDRIIDLP